MILTTRNPKRIPIQATYTGTTNNAITPYHTPQPQLSSVTKLCDISHNLVQRESHKQLLNTQKSVVSFNKYVNIDSPSVNLPISTASLHFISQVSYCYEIKSIVGNNIRQSITTHRFPCHPFLRVKSILPVQIYGFL